MKKEINFPIRVKSAEQKEDGKPHVIAIISDTKRDHTSERFTKNALAAMLKRLKSGKIPLLPEHSGTFELGWAVDGWIEEEADGHQTLFADFVLEADDARAMKLFEQIKAGENGKQLSVGGFLPDWEDSPDAVKWEDDGTLALDDLLLEHVAVTRPGWAANDRCAFAEAAFKGLGFSGRATPYEMFAMAPESFHFSGPSEQAIKNVLALGPDQAKRAGAYLDRDGQVRYVHHVEKDKKIITPLKGVVMAMKDLLVGHEEQLSPADLLAVYSHLAKHYGEFGKKAPAMRRTTEQEFVKHHNAIGLQQKFYANSKGEGGMKNVLARLAETIALAADKSTDKARASIGLLRETTKAVEVDDDSFALLEELAQTLSDVVESIRASQTTTTDAGDAATEPAAAPPAEDMENDAGKTAANTGHVPDPTTGQKAQPAPVAAAPEKTTPDDQAAKALQVMIQASVEKMAALAKTIEGAMGTIKAQAARVETLEKRVKGIESEPAPKQSIAGQEDTGTPGRPTGSFKGAFAAINAIKNHKR